MNHKTRKCYTKKEADDLMKKLSKSAQSAAARKITAAWKRKASAKRSRKSPAKRSRKSPAKRSRKSPAKLSAYNKFMKIEISRVKRANPGLSHKEAFSEAARNWTFQKKPKIARTNRTVRSRKGGLAITV